METIGKNKNIVIMVTGGTILCSYDASRHESIPNVPVDDISDFVSPHKRGYGVVVKEFSNIPSPHLSLELGEKLLKEASEILSREDTAGLVVVQGTDTLEEIAYLFYLVLDTDKPVVFTGSMKSRDELYSDYKGNIDGAVKIIESGKAAGRGVMVYLNQEIHSARYVSKDNTNNIAAFKSPQFGPIGVLYDNEVAFLGKTEAEAHFSPVKLDNNVQLIRVTYSTNELLLRSCINEGVPGVVIEGFGAGNVPPSLIPAIKDAIFAGIPVVLTSRCHTGHVVETYSYEGGGAELRKLGVINGGNLGGIKARIRLIVLLGMQLGIDFVKENF
ncbi:MAG TPA: asparaginase [Bacillota bacterium]|nr:asparaginase [Bacillota bacterium]HPM63448.1 asparaginase [Bacillota bacterium]